MHRRLPARVAGAHHDDGGIPQRPRLSCRCAVEHPMTEQRLEPWHVETPIGHSAGDDHGVGHRDGTVIQIETMRGTRSQTGHRAGEIEVRSKAAACKTARRPSCRPVMPRGNPR